MALVIAGTHSGAGKSTVTLGVLAALRARGLTVQPFKSGPDFIDPGLHTMITGRISRNLDLWMCGSQYVRQCLVRHSADADAAVIEGVMGFYDGAERSTAALAEAVGAQVVLVVDAYGMAESAAAIVRGFRMHGGRIDGVIFNRVGSPRHEARLRDAVRDAFSDEVAVLGCLPRDAAVSIGERHLGLMTAEESPLSDDALSRLITLIEEHCDLDRLRLMAMPIAQTIASLEASPEVPRPEPTKETLTLAVARDRAFCFYYEDNFDMLRAAGVRVEFFSPLYDRELPAGADAVWLGGGYPEMHAEELEGNASMRGSVRQWVQSGRPLYAECGGFMYLGRGIEREGRTYEMSGALPFDTAMRKRRSALGYRTLVLPDGSMFGAGGEELRGHEFHYSEVTRYDEAPDVRYNVFGESSPDGESAPAKEALIPVTSVSYKNTVAGYVHVHFGSNSHAASAMVSFILNHRHGD